MYINAFLLLVSFGRGAAVTDWLWSGALDNSAHFLFRSVLANERRTVTDGARVVYFPYVEIEKQNDFDSIRKRQRIRKIVWCAERVARTLAVVAFSRFENQLSDQA